MAAWFISSIGKSAVTLNLRHCTGMQSKQMIEIYVCWSERSSSLLLEALVLPVVTNRDKAQIRQVMIRQGLGFDELDARLFLSLIAAGLYCAGFGCQGNPDFERRSVCFMHLRSPRPGAAPSALTVISAVLGQTIRPQEKINCFRYVFSLLFRRNHAGRWGLRSISPSRKPHQRS